MVTYRSVFPKRHTFLAVIHVEDIAQALRNARIAFGEGADGVFLINHSISSEELHVCYGGVRELFPKKWIGMNWLDRTPVSGLDMMRPSMGGMWTDNAGVRNNGDVAKAKLFAEKRHEWNTKWNSSFLYFGGVAFKGQEPMTNPARAALLALPFVDVITTSGAGTGIAADVGKIVAMKRTIGEYPLAIASGITPENVADYMEYADCFLVATGVSDSHTELNAKKVAKLAKILS